MHSFSNKTSYSFNLLFTLAFFHSLLNSLIYSSIYWFKDSFPFIYSVKVPRVKVVALFSTMAVQFATKDGIAERQLSYAECCIPAKGLSRRHATLDKAVSVRSVCPSVCPSFSVLFIIPSFSPSVHLHPSFRPSRSRAIITAPPLPSGTGGPCIRLLGFIVHLKFLS